MEIVTASISIAAAIVVIHMTIIIWWNERK